MDTELRKLKEQLNSTIEDPQTVIVPKALEPLFGKVEKEIDKYFSDFTLDPVSGEILINDQRYILFRSDSLSHDFIDFVKERYQDLPENEAISIANNFLFDNAKVTGKVDAIAFHKNLSLKDPLEKLAAGPIHFAYTGWANVEISSESNPSPGENFFLKYQHHNSFEAQAWIKAGKKSDSPVCTMNSGYSTGWCEESFGVSLTAVEISCEAKGDDSCTFIMAPTNKIEDYVEEYVDLSSIQNLEIPVFFKRKHIQERLKKTLDQKEYLIQEIHHRVKNNLQLISSLLKLQMAKIEDVEIQKEFNSIYNRVNTMAVVHELMYQQDDFDNISLSSYFNDLLKSMVLLYSMNKETEIDISIDVKDVEFSLEKSIPLALIINEITCNSFKHALDKGKKFYSHLKQVDETFTLIIGDTGSGLPKENKSNGLGLTLIDILCEQIDAEKIVKSDSNGLEYKIVFNLD